jgi:endonuclease/exonuclease/phosphatase family metal-dependent hydrolase
VDATKCRPSDEYFTEFKASRTKPIPDAISDGSWCQASLPDNFNLNTCNSIGAPLEVKILTYNLYWWNLFGIHHGAGGSAGKLIASATKNSKAFDLMGFQECEDINRVLKDAGMKDEYETVVGPHSIAVAYRKASWTALKHGVVDVAEDRRDQWYGRRSVVWVRLQHASTGRTVFFMNHHGPLPVNSGGMCGAAATVYNILKVAKDNMGSDDVVILTGDFNSDSNSLEVQLMRQRIHEVVGGTVFNGIDHVFSNCAGIALQKGTVPELETRELAGGAGATVVETRDLGSGGSDHHAIEAVVSF